MHTGNQERIDDASRTRLEQLYIMHAQRMIRTANLILHDKMLAEDVVHEAFLRMMNHLEKLPDPFVSKTRNYVVTIAKNIALDLYRKEKRVIITSYDTGENTAASAEDDPEATYYSVELLHHLQRIIDEMHPKYFFVLTMKYVYNYSDKEIAILLKTTHEKVRLLLHRARKQLKSKLISEQL